MRYDRLTSKATGVLTNSNSNCVVFFFSLRKGKRALHSEGGAQCFGILWNFETVTSNSILIPQVGAFMLERLT